MFTIHYGAQPILYWYKMRNILDHKENSFLSDSPLARMRTVRRHERAKKNDTIVTSVRVCFCFFDKGVCEKRQVSFFFFIHLMFE